MMVLTIFYVPFREAFVMPMLVSTGFAVAMAWLIGERLGRGGVGLLCVLALAWSRTTVDFSSSGLENPLSHFLVALFFVLFARGQYTHQRLTYLFLVGALLTLNRLDLCLIVAPSLLYASWCLRDLKAVARAAFLGLLPLILWELFSLVYYGFFIPNTGFAKLGHGLPSGGRLRQGAVYFVRGLEYDPLGLVLLLCSIAAAAVSLRRSPRIAAAGAGVVVYLGYTVRIGGDFMDGRFYSVSIVAGVCVLAMYANEASRRSTNLAGTPGGILVVAAAIVGFGVLAKNPAPSIGSLDLRFETVTGVIDERQFWGPGHHLVGLRKERHRPYDGWAERGRQVRLKKDRVAIESVVGAFGYHAGPSVYILDMMALGDPLLARLPVVRIGWYDRPGHGPRYIPLGYFESLETGKNVLHDPQLREYWDKLRLVVSAPLWSGERWRAIWEMNTGTLDHLIDRSFYQKPYYDEVPASALRHHADGESWQAPGVAYVHPDRGIKVTFDRVMHAESIKISADHNDEYKLEFSRDGKPVGKAKMGKHSKKGQDNLRERRIEIPKTVSSQGFDAVHLTRKGKDRILSLGHVEFDAERAGKKK